MDTERTIEHWDCPWPAVFGVLQIWDVDYGEPVGGKPCYETTEGSGVFKRDWTKASVQWDCAAGHGKVTLK